MRERVREREIASERKRDGERHYFGNCSIRGNLYFYNYYSALRCGTWKTNELHLPRSLTRILVLFRFNFTIFSFTLKSKIRNRKSRAAVREKHGELRLPLNRKRKNKLAKGAVNPMHLRAARRQRSRRGIENKMAISCIGPSLSHRSHWTAVGAGQLVCCSCQAPPT